MIIPELRHERHHAAGIAPWCTVCGCRFNDAVHFTAEEAKRRREEYQLRRFGRVTPSLAELRERRKQARESGDNT